MNRKPHTIQARATRHLQRGATLIEVLVTMVVVALGLMGSAGLLLASTRYQHTSAMRSEAIQQAEFIIEKMRANNARLTMAAAGDADDTIYVAEDAYNAADELPDDPSCGLSGQLACSADASARRDLREWRQSLGQALPGGRGSLYRVETAAGVAQPSSRLVVVMWREKPAAETDTDAALGISRQDPECPAPRVDGIRCLNMWVAP